MFSDSIKVKTVADSEAKLNLDALDASIRPFVEEHFDELDKNLEVKISRLRKEQNDFKNQFIAEVQKAYKEVQNALKGLEFVPGQKHTIILQGKPYGSGRRRSFIEWKTMNPGYGFVVDNLCNSVSQKGIGYFIEVSQSGPDEDGEYFMNGEILITLSA